MNEIAGGLLVGLVLLAAAVAGVLVLGRLTGASGMDRAAEPETAKEARK